MQRLRIDKLLGPQKVADVADAIADMERYIPRHAKMAMLDLVLAWARVDTTIAQLATAAFNMDPTVGAVIFGRMPVPDRLRKMRELNLQLGRTSSASELRKLKKHYEEHSKPRNTIAHAACVGFLKARPYRIPAIQIGRELWKAGSRSNPDRRDEKSDVIRAARRQRSDGDAG